jgi:hypothetical protein
MYELKTLTGMISAVNVTSRDFTGEPVGERQSDRTPASQGSETSGLGYTS